jgi:hypothetical protein
MSLVRALSRCACGGLGMLLLAGAAVPPAAGTAGSDNAGSTAPADAASPATPNPVAPNPAVEGPARSAPVESAPVSSPAAGGTGACLADQACIDRYLWSVYERTPKVDTVNVSSQTKVTVRRKGKTRTVTRTVTNPVGEDFAWKDPKAAALAGMALMDYVIGGMDAGFRVTLYRALRTLDDAGFKPGIMCAFRDDYRQSIATGLKAQNDRSYHGGSFRGGYGHGMAADIVSVRGETRTERLAATSEMWAWIDKHEKDLGIGRPYLDRDPPHVAPIDGQEYADHRLKAKVRYVDTAGRKADAKKADVKREAARKTEVKKTEVKKAEVKKAGVRRADAGRTEARKVDRNPGRIHDLAVHSDRDTVRRTKVTGAAKPAVKVRAPAI